MSYIYRPAQITDLPAIHQVFLDALNDLNVRTGQARVNTPATERENIRRHVLSTDPGGYWVAVDVSDNRVVGWASSIRRGRIWFLSGFWVHPRAQNGGVGTTLLRHSLATAPTAADGGIISVYASRDLRALSLYQRHGMYARFPLLTYTGAADRGRDASDQARILSTNGLTVEQIGPEDLFTSAHAQHIAALDEIVRGPNSDRAMDHQFFHTSGNFTTFLFSRNGHPVAYANLARWGSITPLAAATEQVQEPIMEYLLAEAARRNIASVVMDLPGVNSTVIRMLLARRFTLLGYNFYLTSQPFGQMESYSASGAVLF